MTPTLVHDPPPRAPGRAGIEAVAAPTGLGIAALLVEQHGAGTDAPLLAHLVGLLAGLIAVPTSRGLSGSAWPAGVAAATLYWAAPWAVTAVTVVPTPATLALPFVAGVVTATLCVHAPTWRSAAAVGGAWALIASTAAPASAWSVDEPAGPAMVAGNGVVEQADTHAFLIHRAALILRNDGYTAIARFLHRPDPAGPPRTTYLWRMQLGARDADRRLKPQMSDHFFNWWTHSGKGLIAGPSAATFAEKQFAKAQAAWNAGDASRAMYRLGAAVHLVDDACAPPHQFVLAPNHRLYEEWALHHQQAMAVSSGGIYRDDFRVTTGHGGTAWSSAHTRGWLDECAHRAAELVVNAALPASDYPRAVGPRWHTAAHFRETQRLTAGYIAFFFEQAGGP